MMWPPEAEALWDWSCERYGRPGVAEDCLALQDEYGAAVTLLLLGCWLGGLGRALTPELAAAARNASEGWQDGIVRPLRHARRQLKEVEQRSEGTRRSAIGLLRLAVKEQELSAERIELDELQALMTRCPGSELERVQLAIANLTALVPPAVRGAPMVDRLVIRLLE